MIHRGLVRGSLRLLGPAPRRRSSILKFQGRCLRSLVRHAYRNVPYYGDLFKNAGLKPSDIQSVEDIGLIPITSRQDIQDQPESEFCWRTLRPERLRKHRTSGSSGAPLTIQRLLLEDLLLLASRVVAYRQAGIPLWARVATISRITDKVRRYERESRVHSWLGIRKRRWIDWELPAQELVSEVERFRPQIISGAPSILAEAGQKVAIAGLTLPRPRFITTHSETLTPELRRQIESSFQARIYDNYSCHEFVGIAQQLDPDGHYRLQEDSVLVEVLSADGKPVQPGESGELIGTALHSYAMPLIRYRLGDWVTLGQDSIEGKPYRTLSRVVGRTIDFFYLSDGRVIHPYEISILVRDAGLPIRRFQILQLEQDRFEIHLLVRSEPSSERLQEVARLIETKIAPLVEVEFKVVPKLSRYGEKFRPYVSLQRLSAGESTI